MSDSNSGIKLEVKKAHVKIVLIAVAVVLAILLIVVVSKPKAGSEKDAISEAKNLFKAEMQRDWTDKLFKSVKFDEVTAEAYRDGGVYRINGEAIVSLKKVWATHDNGKNWDYYDLEKKYHFVYDLSWYDGKWKLEGSNHSELGNVK